MKTKLICVDTSNVLYMTIFNPHLREKYQGLTTEALIGKEDELVRDVFKGIMEKVFNMLSCNDEDYKITLLFAKDSKTIWRKNIFKEYKDHRKAIRDVSPVDFKIVYQVFDRVWDIMKDALPYRFISVLNAEIDDIIAEAITQEHEKWDCIQIYSSDEDFIQLMKYSNVEIYNPRICKFVKDVDSKYFLFEKVIKGCAGDNVPCIYSDTRTERQKSIREAQLKEWYNDKQKFKDFITLTDSKVKKNYIRNRQLVDLSLIPDNIKIYIDKELIKNTQEFDMRKFSVIGKKYGIIEMTTNLELILKSI
jgi:hypothetical protein